MKTTGQTTPQRQPLPSDENLEISQHAIWLEFPPTNLEEQVKKQNELIKKLIKKSTRLKDIFIR